MDVKLKYEILLAEQEAARQEFRDKYHEIEGVKTARRIDQLTTFSTDKHTYHLISDVSWNRLKALERFRVKLGAGYSWDELLVKVGQIMEDMNGSNFVQAAVKLNNLQLAISDELKHEPHPMYDVFCVLAIREDEDASIFDPVLHAKKVKDIENSNISSDSVFQLAAELVSKSLPTLKQSSQIGS